MLELLCTFICIQYVYVLNCKLVCCTQHRIKAVKRERSAQAWCVSCCVLPFTPGQPMVTPWRQDTCLTCSTLPSCTLCTKSGQSLYVQRKQDKAPDNTTSHVHVHYIRSLLEDVACPKICFAALSLSTGHYATVLCFAQDTLQCMNLPSLSAYVRVPSGVGCHKAQSDMQL